ncbi:hypothetical protein ASE06_11590 [Sphingopyxis sp. Root214]|uniref:HEPN domain-containing protein n=1 Tax=unclassified Sphingopyxis TaxID=2614943 RepID=UPI0006F32271|nr:MULTISPECIES: HEPN domain-containing protein [unclassified Sphingopyxis]KQZ73071.1 hypothetical protein ASD73_09240 [Sphingopyxis sp. Root154]KRC07218.1 hypothetical protein ASE06_11590 [Sphingopyxis sp. Root214]
MTGSSDFTIAQKLVDHFSAAFEATVAAIHVELAAGKKPRGKRNHPKLDHRANGMPALSGGNSWDSDGGLQYADLLERESDSTNPFHRPRFEPGRFAEVDALIDFIRTNPGCSMNYAPEPPAEGGISFDLTRVQIELQLAHAANRFFQRYGEVACDSRKRRAIMKPFIYGLFDDQLRVTNIIPIALVKFDFDRIRLAPDSYVIRMSDALQRARWAAKSYAANGHDGVVSAATHAFVLTGWHWPNQSWIAVIHDLAAHTPPLREKIEELFGALRLVTGVSTGFAQELRVARGWTHFHSDAPPEVFAAGARRYPEEFDNYGWMRDEIPVVTRDTMHEVAADLGRLRSIQDERFALALRRMNSAMIRSDVSDAILDSTIALEILLGDRAGEAINYKLKMRAAALANLETPGTGDAVRKAIGQTYDLRSRIVHGSRGRNRPNVEVDLAAARRVALDTLRRILRIVAKYPHYLDPLRIDSELLLG